MMSSYLLTAVSDSASILRSANYRACVVPRTQNSFGDRAFSVAGPKIWNNLPQELRHVDISFGQPRYIVTFWLFRLRSFLTYLLTYLLTYMHCAVAYAKAWNGLAANTSRVQFPPKQSCVTTLGKLFTCASVSKQYWYWSNDGDVFRPRR